VRDIGFSAAGGGRGGELETGGREERAMGGGWRMSDRLLADMLGRLATALSAGIDLRRAWAAEASRVPRPWRPAMQAVARGIAAGDGLAAALARAGGAFPPHVRAVVAVGDAGGRDAEVLRDLAAALENGLRGRRALRAALVGPVLRLVLAVVVLGVLILVSGSIADLDGRPVDMLGLGLTGRAGLIRFCGGIGAGLVLVALLWPLAARSWADRGIVRLLAVWIPILGPAVRAAEAAAWCRAAGLASHVGLDVGRLVALASAAAPALRVDPGRVAERLRGGATLEEALAQDGRLPRAVLDAVAVGELTGTTAETLERLAGRLDEEARAGYSAAVGAVGFLAWAAVAGLIALVIFRVASFYFGILNQAMNL
jgi:type IV pilus assembly protein PilC